LAEAGISWRCYRLARGAPFKSFMTDVI